jgi:capsular polysaccharide export protein
LLWGLPVTTVGAPFYSGWGLTDERQPVERRNRKLSLEEVFAAAYLLYPRYQDPYTSEKLSLEETITRLLKGQENIK